MLSPAQMRKARIFILERDEERVVRTLGMLGAVHLRSSVEESGGDLQPEELDKDIQQHHDLLKRTEHLLEDLGLGVPEHLDPAEALRDLREARELIGSLESRTQAQRSELDGVHKESEELDELILRLEPYREVRSALSRLTESEFLSVQAGTLDEEGIEPLREALPPGVMLVLLGPHRQDARRRTALVVCARRRRFAAETVLDEHGFERVDVPTWEEQTPADVYAGAAARRQGLAERHAELEAALEGIGDAYGHLVRRAWHAATLQLRLLEARQKLGATWAARVVTGWVPTDSAERLRQAVLEETRGRCVVEISEPTQQEVQGDLVPTQMKHHALLRPFQRLVRGYGVPGYREVEPTVFFAVSFLLMFGLIFGDLGHGLLLALIGWFVSRRARAAAVRDVGRVVLLAGLTSAVFGTVFQGSFFGKSLRDMGFPFTFGFEPMRFGTGEAGAAGGDHVTRYLLLCIVVGIVLISLGVVLNVVNRLRRGDLAGGLLGRFGVVGIVLYWGTLGLAVKLAVAGAGKSDLWVVLAVIVLPLVLLTLGEPLGALLAHRKRLWEEGAAIGFFSGAVEALETVITYVANTFSFLRVAAFALSHAALSFTIFVVDRLVEGLPGGAVWAAAVFVVGTALVIALEGLIATIQILRLEYYEFFSKFFRGEGVRYEPFRLGGNGEAD